MIAASDSNLLIARLAMGGLMIGLFWRFLVWVREAPVTPDPWDAETDKKLSEPETSQACHHCSTPLTDTAWFCPHCGCAVGPYNNLMPYLYIFSEGEVYRNGVNQRFRNRPLIFTGYLFITILFFPVVSPFFAPIYLIVLFCYFVLVVKNLLSSKPPGQVEI